MSDFYSIPEAAALLGCSARRLRQKADAGELTGALQVFGNGSRWRVPKATVEALLGGQRPSVVRRRGEP
jgi:excisionase family DNA binding protein